MIPQLQTPRLILRPPVAADIPQAQEKFPHWEIVRHLAAGVPWPYPPDGAKTFFENSIFPRIAAGEIWFWVLAPKDSPDILIGAIEVRRQDSGDGHRGFWLALPYHGKGLMSEAVTAVNDFVFGAGGMKKIIIKNALSNLGSRRVKEKTGAIFLRQEPGHYVGGEAMSEVWELTAARWQEFRRQRKD